MITIGPRKSHDSCDTHVGDEISTHVDEQDPCPTVPQRDVRTTYTEGTIRLRPFHAHAPVATPDGGRSSPRFPNHEATQADRRGMRAPTESYWPGATHISPGWHVPRRSRCASSRRSGSKIARTATPARAARTFSPRPQGLDRDSRDGKIRTEEPDHVWEVTSLFTTTSRLS
jgi:hypothetical protein